MLFWYGVKGGDYLSKGSLGWERLVSYCQLSRIIGRSEHILHVNDSRFIIERDRSESL